MSFAYSTSAFSILFRLVFIGVTAAVLFILIKSLAQWRRNNQSPRLAVAARVVAKRCDRSVHQPPVGGDITGAHGFHSSSSTYYYATFQVESGDRMELALSGSDYGMLAEGDTGILHFQGTRYLGFDRD